MEKDIGRADRGQAKSVIHQVTKLSVYTIFGDLRGVTTAPHRIKGQRAGYVGVESGDVLVHFVEEYY